MSDPCAHRLRWHHNHCATRSQDTARAEPRSRHTCEPALPAKQSCAYCKGGQCSWVETAIEPAMCIDRGCQCVEAAACDVRRRPWQLCDVFVDKSSIKLVFEFMETDLDAIMQDKRSGIWQRNATHRARRRAFDCRAPTHADAGTGQGSTATSDVAVALPYCSIASPAVCCVGVMGDSPFLAQMQYLAGRY